MSPKVILYTSSVSFSSHCRSHTGSLKHILDSKGVEYEEVDLATNRERAEEMVKVSGGERALPQLHIDEKVRRIKKRRRRKIKGPVSPFFSLSSHAPQLFC